MRSDHDVAAKFIRATIDFSTTIQTRTITYEYQQASYLPIIHIPKIHPEISTTTHQSISQTPANCDMLRRKSLLIGINYKGTDNELNGCHKDVENIAEFIRYRGYQDTPQDQVVLRDDLTEEYLPTGHNILAAMDWLVSEEHTTCFFHYSGHGGQINDPNGKRPSGLLDTIVPVDFEDNGQIDSDMLHQHLVTKLPPSSTLFLILDCCHSGSTLELPFVYRSDDDGQVHKLNTYEAGVELLKEAKQMMTGAFSSDKEAQARDLYAGATSFLRSMRHNRQLTGVVADDFTKE
jgi:hypothetical protein